MLIGIRIEFALDYLTLNQGVAGYSIASNTLFRRTHDVLVISE